MREKSRKKIKQVWLAATGVIILWVALVLSFVLSLVQRVVGNGD